MIRAKLLIWNWWFQHLKTSRYVLSNYCLKFFLTAPTYTRKNCLWIIINTRTHLGAAFRSFHRNCLMIKNFQIWYVNAFSGLFCCSLIFLINVLLLLKWELVKKEHDKCQYVSKSIIIIAKRHLKLVSTVLYMPIVLSVDRQYFCESVKLYYTAM